MERKNIEIGKDLYGKIKKYSEENDFTTSRVIEEAFYLLQPYQKPPLGIMPKCVWKSIRDKELNEAINRYHDAGLPIPIEWIEEYNEYVKKQEVKEANDL